MRPLDQQTRRKIFFLMLLLFVVVAPLVILYSQGYVFDIRGRGLTATGGIFIKSAQMQTQVFLDGVLEGETTFFSRGMLFTSLASGRYTIRAEKPGYQPWQKTPRVTNGEVIEFRNIFLPPATVTPRLAFSVETRSAVRVVDIPKQNEVVLEIGDEGKPKTLLILDSKTWAVRGRVTGLTRWLWDARTKEFVASKSEGAGTQWVRIPFEGNLAFTAQSIRFRGLPAGFSPEAVSLHPTKPDEFYFLAGGALFLQTQAAVPIPIAEQVVSYAITGDHLYFLSKSGFFVESSLEGEDVRVLGRKGLFVDDTHSPRVIPSPLGDVLVIDSAGGLFLYQPGFDQELQFLFGNIQNVAFNQTGNSALLWDDHRFWLFWLRDNAAQPFDLARTKRQLYYSESPVLQAALNDSGTHFFFLSEDGIWMAETDDRSGINAYRLMPSAISSFSHSNIDPWSLFWVSGQKLFRVDLS